MRQSLVALTACALLLPAAAAAQVTPERLVNAAAEPHNWLTYSGTYASQRHSTLDRITSDNVGDLEMKWVFQSRTSHHFQATPLVVDGIMYHTQPPNDVVALDARTGRVFWVYEHVPSPDARPCCGFSNRGLAIAGDTLLMGTVDAMVVAVDAKSGGPHLEDAGGRSHLQLRDHPCPAGGQRQGDRRHVGRRHGHPRLHRGLRRGDGARRPGASTPFRDRASRGTRPGSRAPRRWSTATPRRGRPAGPPCG